MPGHRCLAFKASPQVVESLESKCVRGGAACVGGLGGGRGVKGLGRRVFVVIVPLFCLTMFRAPVEVGSDDDPDVIAQVCGSFFFYFLLPFVFSFQCALRQKTSIHYAYTTCRGKLLPLHPAIALLLRTIDVTL